MCACLDLNKLPKTFIFSILACRNITFSHILCSPSLYMNVSMFIKFYRRPSRQFVRIHEAKETCVVGYISIVPCITVFSQGLA